MKALALATVLFVAAPGVSGGEFDLRVPIQHRGTSTYYVNGHIEGFGQAQLMVDTGSGYSTISEDTLAILLDKGHARYSKDLRGIMADGSRKIVKVYTVTSITIGGDCAIRDIEVAVFPARTRPILGLNALRKVAPFVFSIDPPSLLLSNCLQEVSEAATTGGEPRTPAVEVGPAISAPQIIPTSYSK